MSNRESSGVGPRVAAPLGLLVAALLCVSPASSRADNDCRGKGSLRLVNGKIHTMDAKNRVVS